MRPIAHISLQRTADLTEQQRAALAALSAVVYPAEEWKDWPGWRIEWADMEWCACLWDQDGNLTTYVGIVVRNATVDGNAVRIGGIGSVKTHPAARGLGYARIGIEHALRFLHDQDDVSFALLVCEPHLLPYYGKLGWNEFTGRLLVAQRGAVEEFTFNRVMTHGIRTPGPVTGVIDLCGPPW